MLLDINNMTIEQKLGMVICARRFEEEDIEFIISLIRNHALGCIQMPTGRPELMNKILAEADYPLLVINDTEMGFPTSPLPKVPLISLSACGKEEYYEAFAKGVVQDAQAAGYNGTWGPVIDVLRKDGPCRVHRSFSNKPMQVAQAAEVIAKIYKQNHFLSTGKHYPGESDSPYDSHMTEAYSYSTEEELIENALVPYMYLHERGLLPSIMTGHCTYLNIDPEYPASLSKKVIDIIRRLGFDGVTFTDSFAMMGVLQRFGEDKLYGMAIAAGNDIVLPNYRTAVKDVYEMLVKNYYDGAFSEERLNEAVRRVLTAQEFVAQKPKEPTIFTKEDELTLNCVARDCITAVTDDGVGAALSDNKKRLFVVMDQLNSRGGISEEIGLESWYSPARITEKLRAEFPQAGIEIIPEFPGQAHNEYILNEATKYEEVVFVTACETMAYLGTDGLTRRIEAVINCLVHSKKVSTIVHFGNPYALKNIDHVSRKIFGYLIPESQRFAVDVLAGKLEPKGVLPFDVDFR